MHLFVSALSPSDAGRAVYWFSETHLRVLQENQGQARGVATHGGLHPGPLRSKIQPRSVPGLPAKTLPGILPAMNTLVQAPGVTTHWFRYGRGCGEMLSMTSGERASVFFTDVDRNVSPENSDLGKLISVGESHGPRFQLPPRLILMTVAPDGWLVTNPLYVSVRGQVGVEGHQVSPLSLPDGWDEHVRAGLANVGRLLHPADIHRLVGLAVAHVLPNPRKDKRVPFAPVISLFSTR